MDGIIQIRLAGDGIMKKVIAMLLLAVLLLSLCSCSEENAQKAASSKETTGFQSTPTQPSKAQTPTAQTAPTQTAPTQTAPTQAPTANRVCSHIWTQWAVKKQSTCQYAGLKERTCRLCQVTESKAMDKVGHKESGWLVKQPAQVGVDGLLYTQCIYCKIQMQKQIVPALTEAHQHKIVKWVTEREADCTHTGREVAICSCGQTLATKELPACHFPMTDLGEIATCFVTGLTEGQHCGACGEVLIPQKVIEKLPHTPEPDEAVPATCTECGYTAGSHCSVCYTYFVKPQVIPAKGHSMASKVIESAVETERHTLHYCTACS